MKRIGCSRGGSGLMPCWPKVFSMVASLGVGKRGFARGENRFRAIAVGKTQLALDQIVENTIEARAAALIGVAVAFNETRVSAIS